MRIVFGSPYRRQRGYGGYNSYNRGGRGLRLVLGGIIALIAIASYFFMASENPVTGKKERVGAYTPEDEVAMGYAAAPEMVQQMGGAKPRGNAKQQLVEEVGLALLDAPYAQGNKSLRQILEEKQVPWKFAFTLLEDDQTVNAFALPGGPVFITEALFDRLENEAQLAGVLGHEIGHVIERHGLERLASAQMMQGIAAGVGVAADDGSGSGYNAAVLAQTFGQLLQLGYSREAELESDGFGLAGMVAAGYDPREMIRVMEILRDASGGGGSGPEFMQTHPHPESRIEGVEKFVREKLPDGVPVELTKGRALR